MTSFYQPAIQFDVEIDALFVRCQEQGIEMLLSEEFPSELLRQSHACPRLLFTKGDRTALRGPALAIVGTRRPTAYGLQAAHYFGRKMAEHKLVVVSGLARGVDAAAHTGALAARGLTVAVLGHGLDQVYPRENTYLAQRIIDSGGCLVSEYPPGTPPLKLHFPARNRIIAGLCLGTLVIEAAQRSGSLITARQALDNNREVYVVCGRFDSESFGGSHRLIQEGAKLVTSVDDILEDAMWPRCVSAPGTQKISGLKKVFERFGFALTLEDLLREYGDQKSELFEELEEQIEEGYVVDAGQQRYLWVR